MKQSELLKEDLSQIESVLIELEQSADIWQNKVIKIMCRCLYHVLTYLIRTK